MNAKDTQRRGGRLTTALVGISAMLIGFLVQLDIFEWLLNIVGWLLVIGGTITLISSLGSRRARGCESPQSRLVA